VNPGEILLLEFDLKLNRQWRDVDLVLAACYLLGNVLVMELGFGSGSMLQAGLRRENCGSNSLENLTVMVDQLVVDCETQAHQQEGSVRHHRCLEVWKNEGQD
jgi:hypothetical protein